MTGSKIINGIIGVIIAVVLSMLLTLGIKVFYPEPKSPYENYNYAPKAVLNTPCDSKDQACIVEYKKAQQEHGHKIDKQGGRDDHDIKRDLDNYAPLKAEHDDDGKKKGDKGDWTDNRHKIIMVPPRTFRFD